MFFFRVIISQWFMAFLSLVSGSLTTPYKLVLPVLSQNPFRFSVLFCEHIIQKLLKLGTNLLENWTSCNLAECVVDFKQTFTLMLILKIYFFVYAVASQNTGVRCYVPEVCFTDDCTQIVLCPSCVKVVYDNQVIIFF